MSLMSLSWVFNCCWIDAILRCRRAVYVLCRLVRGGEEVLGADAGVRIRFDTLSR